MKTEIYKIYEMQQKSISKFMMINARIEKRKISKKENLTLHLKELEEKQPMSKISQKKKKE